MKNASWKLLQSRTAAVVAEARVYLDGVKDKAVEVNPTSDPWYEVSNAADDTATIRIYGVIGDYWDGMDAESFASDLADITASTIEVQINSPGGSVFDGLAIFNALRTHPARIVTRIDGLAASAASFIAQAGDERVVVDSAQVMIHDASCVSFGNAADHRDAADFCERQSANIAALYATRAGLDDSADFVQMMHDETWFSADEAVAAGLADTVMRPKPKTDDEADNAMTVKLKYELNFDTSTAAAKLVAAAEGQTEEDKRERYLRTFQLQRT